MVVRENFEKDLQELKEQMIEMSELTISALEKAFTALQTQDVEQFENFFISDLTGFDILFIVRIHILVKTAGRN